MKIAITGANGQLGSDVMEVLHQQNYQTVALNHQEIEITDLDAVKHTLGQVKPDILINCAAYSNVENCEHKFSKAFYGNAIGPKNLAEAAKDQGIYLVHISTDYVFDGSKQEPYIETDLPKPLNVYGNSKLSGEYFVQSIAEYGLVMRTSGIYGKNPCRTKGGNNFVNTMLKFGREKEEVRVVDYEILTPTATKEIAYQIVQLVENPVYGLCHATAEGQCTWYEFTKAIYHILNWDVNLNIAAPGEFPTRVNRPTYSVLENKVLKDQGINTFRHWKDGLKDYLLHEQALVPSA